MTSKSLRICAALYLLALPTFAGAQLSSPPANSQAPSPPDYQIEQRLGHQIPLDLAFSDETGKSVKLKDYFSDKPVVLVLAYYRCPRLCSLVLNGLVEGLRQVDYQIGKDFTVLTVSIDPREGPELAAAKKRSYVDAYGRSGAESGWHFLTTRNNATIRHLADAVGYRYEYDAGRDLFGHGSGIMMLSPDGTLTRYFYGVTYPRHELQFGIEDSSAGKVGTPVANPVRMLCFMYDPVTGKYSFMTMRIVRMFSALTVGVLALLLVRAWRRDRVRDRVVKTTITPSPTAG